jgi:hypothetical protein
MTKHQKGGKMFFTSIVVESAQQAKAFETVAQRLQQSTLLSKLR